MAESDTARSSADEDEASGRGRAATADDRSVAAANEALDNLSEQIRRINAGEGDALEEITAILGSSSADGQLLKWHRRFAWATAAVLLLYPLGMLFSALLSFLWQRREPELLASDRLHLWSQLFRRAALSFVLIGLIAVVTIGTIQVAWWTDPVMLSLLCVTAAILGLIATTLSTLIKQANREQTLKLVREVRRHQLEVRKDVEELRKRLRQVTISGG